MKKLNNIYYNYIYSVDNLTLAQFKAQQGKGKRYEIDKFNDDLINNLIKLWEILKDETYVPGKYRIKKIYEPKERNIMIAPFFPDRIIHHCVINLLGNHWAKIFIQNTYACIKGRGIHKCMKDVHRALISNRSGTKYCLKIDIRKFYDNVNHQVLKNIVRHKIADAQMLRLLDKIIDSPGGIKGLPIGNYTSQYFANLYLSYFDHFMKETMKVKYYYRYMDDIVILDRDKKTLHKLLDAMGLYLGAELKLEIKNNWQIFPVDSRCIDYVGYKQDHDNILLRKSILIKFYRKLKKVQKRYLIENEEDIKHLFPSEYGWVIKCNKEHRNFILKKCINYEKTKCRVIV